MRALLRELRSIFVSLKLTVVLIALSIMLVLAATLDQVNIGIWAVQEKYFHTFAVFWNVGELSLAIFPGGYTLGGLLLINLVAAHLSRFRFTWRQAGMHLVHGGLIVLLLGELFTGLWQDEYQMRLDEGQTKNYSESYRGVELAITDVSGREYDEVVAIPEPLLADQATVQHPKLPFRVAIKSFFPNSALEMRGAGSPPAAATTGAGTQLAVVPRPLTYKQDERNVPSGLVELIGTEGPIGTWLVSVLLIDAQRFEHAGRSWKIELRFSRHYHPFSLTLLEFTHERYAGTEIPKNFSSRVRLNTPDGSDNREVLIYMNNPLRYAGLTFYQAGFDNNDATSILQVVRNPSWLLPYVACGLMTAGLLFQFGLHLTKFIRRRSQAAPAAA